MSADLAPALHALSVRSKAHWGYDDAFMRLATPALAVSASRFGEGRVHAASIGRDLAGVMVIAPPDPQGIAELEHLFVEPSCMSRGVGRLLLRHAVAIARSDGARRIGILSDPQARSFYERHGARWIADLPSDAIPGRMLPRLEIALDDG